MRYGKLVPLAAFVCAALGWSLQAGAQQTSSQLTGYCPRPCPPTYQQGTCPPGYQPYAPTPAVPPAAEGQPQAPSPAAPSEAPSDYVSPDLFAGSPGAGFASAGVSAAPNMIGDHFGDAFRSLTLFSSYDDTYSTVLPSPSTAIVGRLKIADNGSPIPQDRIIFNYSYYHDVPLTPQGLNVNRFTPGFEKTFLGGMASLEARFPMAVTMDSTLTVDNQFTPTAPTDFSSGEFGDIVLTPKVLLYQGCDWALGAGVGVTIPTADDLVVRRPNGNELGRIESDAVFLKPYFGVVWTPNQCFFAQAFLEYDFALNGNGVYVSENGLRGGGDINRVGVLQDRTYQYLDVSAGFWLHRNDCGHALVRGIALITEHHWNASLNDADSLVFVDPQTDDQYVVREGVGDISIHNALVGGLIDFGRSTLTVGYGFPVSDDEVFDGELRVNFNYWFGQTAARRGVY